MLLWGYFECVIIVQPSLSLNLWQNTANTSDSPHLETGEGEPEVMYNGEFRMFGWKQESKIVAALLLCFPPSEFPSQLIHLGKWNDGKLLSTLTTPVSEPGPWLCAASGFLEKLKLSRKPFPDLTLNRSLKPYDHISSRGPMCSLAPQTDVFSWHLHSRWVLGFQKKL